MSTQAPSDVVSTYFGLRIALVLLVVLLFTSVIIQVLVAPGCVPTSISAYYYTPARPALIAALGAVGVCLILYQGSTDVEDVFLNFSGFMAAIVAFVPIGLDPASCGITDPPTPAEIAQASGNNVAALLVVGLIGAVISLATSFGATRSPASRVAAVVTTLALVAGTVFFAVERRLFQGAAHVTAAIALFVGIIIVVLMNARHADRAVYRAVYGVIAVAMVIGSVLSFLFGGRYAVFWIETTLIVLFGVYWGVQTYELRFLRARASTRTSRLMGRNWVDAGAP